MVEIDLYVWPLLGPDAALRQHLSPDEAQRAARYAAWDKPENQAMLRSDLACIEARVRAEAIDPQPKSGRQERLENLWNRFV